MPALTVINDFMGHLSADNLMLVNISVLLFLVESWLLIVAKRRGLLLKGIYWRWHTKHGLIKMAAIKFLLIMLAAIHMRETPIVGAYYGGILISYTLLVVLLFGQLITKQR